MVENRQQTFGPRYSTSTQSASACALCARAKRAFWKKVQNDKETFHVGDCGDVAPLRERTLREFKKKDMQEAQRKKAARRARQAREQAGQANIG